MFLLKSDISLSDSKLFKLGFLKQTQFNERLLEVENLILHLFGEKPGEIRFIDSGTFNLIYLIILKNHQKFIVKLPIKMENFTIPNFFKQSYIHNYLNNKNIPVPKILFSNHLKINEDQYIIMEFIVGNTLDSLANHPENHQKSIKILAKSLIKVHDLEVDGFGLLEFSPKEQRIKGCFDFWKNYLISNLDEHLHICIQMEYLSKSDVEFIHRAFLLLEKNLSISAPKLLHGDLGPKNAIIDDNFNKISLIDWEDSLGGDPIFDIAMWGSFLFNTDKLEFFLDEYYQNTSIPNDFFVLYYLYYLRIVIAKSIHRYRFQTNKHDKVSPKNRLVPIVEKLKGLL